MAIKALYPYYDYLAAFDIDSLFLRSADVDACFAGFAQRKTFIGDVAWKLARFSKKISLNSAKLLQAAVPAEVYDRAKNATRDWKGLFWCGPPSCRLGRVMLLVLLNGCCMWLDGKLFLRVAVCH